jgi:outer membrane protein assembly factor BamD (BamD/ComL family)
MKQILILLISLGTLGCATFQSDFAEGTPPEVIIQRAQEAFDAAAYEDALVIYSLALERFGEDPNYKATILYEIAFTRYKMGEIGKARVGFVDLLALYEDPELAPFLPTWPAVLAEKILNDLPPEGSEG